MKDLDAAFGALITTAARFDVPAGTIVARARRRTRRRRAIEVTGALVVVAGLTAGAVGTRPTGESKRPSISVVTPTTPAAPGAPVVFREVLGQIPYGTTTASPTADHNTCHGGRAISRIDAADHEVILADSAKTVCYILGPTLLSDPDVASVTLGVNPTTAAWYVNVHFANDDFVTKVAQPEVNKQIGIIVDGIVQSAPNINPGITGRDVTIEGAFDEAGARSLAELISPAAVTVVPTTAPSAPSLLAERMQKRCESVRQEMRFGDSLSGSAITAADARAAFVRASQPIPSALANISGDEQLAMCSGIETTTSGVTPTSTCADGTSFESGPFIGYAVDSQLTVTRLPELKYLYSVPPGATPNAPPDFCHLRSG